MFAIIELCGYFALVFAVSVGASYALTNLRLRKSISPPLPDATLQIRSGGALYRAKFVRNSASGWVIGAPLSRDAYVPLRVGEQVSVWAPTNDGLRSFETEILERDATTHEFTLAIPHRAGKVERRQSPRIRTFADPSVQFEGQRATLIDLSENGARVFAPCVVKKGERVRIDLSGNPAYGWILESNPKAQGCEVRLVFEERLSAI